MSGPGRGATISENRRLRKDGSGTPEQARTASRFGLPRWEVLICDEDVHASHKTLHTKLSVKASAAATV